MTSSNVVQIPQKPKALTSAQACIRLKDQGYDEQKHEDIIRSTYTQLVANGFRPVLLHKALKRPVGDEWQKQPLPEIDKFVGYSNIGILTGEAGGDICDVDIDIDEMIDVLPEFLPDTPYKFGRFYGTGKQRIGHWLYKVTDSAGHIKVGSPFSKGSIEIRTNGNQTMCPGSVFVDHEINYETDCVRWAGNTTQIPSGAITVTTREELYNCAKVGLASYHAADYFKPGTFHEDMMYWCGFLICAGVPDSLVEKSIKYIVRVSGQTDEHDRLNSIATTHAQIEKTGTAAGIGFLKKSEHWPDDVCRWLSQLLKYGGVELEDNRPSVRVVSSREPQWLDLTLTAMKQTEKFYQMAGQACIITKVEGKAHIVPIDKGINAASWLTREIRFTQSTMDKATGVITDQDIKCPTSLALEVADATTYKGDLPVLMGVSNTPLITRNGRVIEDSWNYDADLKLFFCSEFPVQPMYRDEALPILNEVLADFPFVSGRYKSSAISAILTAVCRPVLDICPLYVITSSQYSDGKSVLSGLIAASCGVEASMAALTRGGADEEQEKQLSAILSRGRRVVTLDNHDGEFKSAAITETLTSTNPEFRILGKNETRSVPNKTMFLLNGVNTTPALDLQTRSVFVRLARTSVDPNRKFKHPDVVGYALANRAKLVSASISLIKWAMEQEDGEWKPNHRFKVWDYMVRRTIQLACGVDVAPPVSEDEDRTVDSSEEARYNFLEFALLLWNTGLRSAKSATGTYFTAADLAGRIGVDSEEEAWVTTLSKRPRQDLTQRCGVSLNTVKDYPFQDKVGATWRVVGYSVKGRSAYKFEQIDG